MATAKLLGRGTASTGAIEELTVWSGLSLSWTTLSAQSIGASVFYTGTAQASSATPNTWTTLNFNNERYDTSSFHDNITNNPRLTVPASWTYRICAWFYFQSAASWNANWIGILKNWTTLILERPLRDAGGAGNQDYSFDVSVADVASSGDYYEVQIKSTASANMSVVWSSTASNAFEITRI